MKAALMKTELMKTKLMKTNVKSVYKVFQDLRISNDELEPVNRTLDASILKYEQVARVLACLLYFNLI